MFRYINFDAKLQNLMDRVTMIGKTLLVLVLLLCIALEGEAQKAPNMVDSNGLKQGKWEKYDANGRLVYTGTFLNDLPVDTFNYYFDNGMKKAQLIYGSEEVSREALSKIFNRKGMLMSEGSYLRKKRHGYWRFYDEEGQMISEEYYDEGKKVGVWKVYYYDGTLNEETSYEEDKKSGPWKQYFTDGSLKLKGMYRNGLLEGESMYFHPNGKVMIHGSYIHNLKHGKWFFYDEEGVLVKEQEYRMGKPLEEPDDREE